MIHRLAHPMVDQLRFTRSEFMRGLRAWTRPIRHALGHERLPQLVGSIDRTAPYRPDRAGRSVRSRPR